MNVGPLAGPLSSVAGAPLAQAKGSDAEHAQNEAASHERRVASDRRADSAAGIGQTDGEDHQTAERDADGRRIWEETGRRKKPNPDAPSDLQPPRSKDATGQSGTLLDLSG